MKILVLGSDGQVGSSLFTHLESIGHDVVGFDIFSNKEQDLRIVILIGTGTTEISFIRWME